MEARIQSRLGVNATTDQLWERIGDLSTWSSWNPVERDVAGAIAFGGRLTFNESIPGLPERAGSGTVAEWQPLTRLVWTERRGFLFQVVRYFEIDELAPGSCIFANGFIFSGLRGELHHDRHRAVYKAAVTAVGEGMQASLAG